VDVRRRLAGPRRLSAPAATRIAGNPLAGVGAALPDFALAFVFLAVWISPESFGEKMVSWCLLVMLLEFFIVHSAGFTGFVMTSSEPAHRKVLGMLILGVFYTLMVGGVSMSMESWWPVVSFWGLMANRMLGGLLGGASSPDDREFVIVSWAASVFFYLVFVFITVIGPIPAFGITPAVIAAQEFTSSGEWIRAPYRVVAFGFLYFLAIGISELFMHRWFGRPTGAAVATG
jgi:hypothetical protein